VTIKINLQQSMSIRCYRR